MTPTLVAPYAIVLLSVNVIATEYCRTSCWNAIKLPSIAAWLAVIAPSRARARAAATSIVNASSNDSDFCVELQSWIAHLILAERK